MTKIIGRLFNVGLSHENTRGTPEAAELWLPAIDLKVDEQAEQLPADQTRGVITDATGLDIIHKNTTCELKARVGDVSMGFFLLAALGSEDGTPTLVNGSSVAYDHDFVLYENAQHPTFCISVEEPNATGSSGLQYGRAALEKLVVDVEPTKYVELTANLTANAKTTATHSVTYTAENVFLPQHVNVKFAANLAGLGAASAIEVKKLNLVINKNLEDDRVIGNVGVADRLNKQFEVEGTIEVLYTDRTYIDEMLAGTAQAMRIIAANTDVTIGGNSNPTITIDFAKVMFRSIARDLAKDGLVRQTLAFKAFYSASDTSTLTATLRNTRSTAY